jgi:Ca-activated chloride channel family protein
MAESTRYLQLASPSALWLLLLAAALAWLLWRSVRKRREALRHFSSEALASRLVVSPLWANDGLRAACLVASVALLAVAAARPKLGTRLERVERKGADIVVAIDTSDSMLAEDAQPSRLEAAKREVLGLIARLQGDRVGIVTFSSQAFLYCPLTTDYDAAAMFLDSIDAEVTSGAGTALREAIAASMRAFEAGEGQEKAMVLVSDGEDWGEGALAAARAARAEGTKIHAIGIGTEEGAPVPEIDEEGERGGVRREGGKVVVTRLDERQLREIAAAGGGKYVKGGTADYGAAAVYQQVAAAESTRAGYYTFKAYAERFQWPLGGALLLLGLEFVMRMWPLKRQPRRTPAAGLVAVALMCLLATSGFSLLQTAAALCRSANELFEQGRFAEALERYTRALGLDPENPILHFNSGDALYRKGDFAKAREHFAEAASEAPPDMAGAAHYNAGNSYLREGNTDAAIEEYKNALRCDPHDRLAKRNLELAQKMKQQQQQDDQQDQQQDQQRDERKDRDQQGKQEQSREKEKDQPKPQPQTNEEEREGQPQNVQAMPMTPEEARALLRQAEYEDAQLRKEIVRLMPQPTETTGKDW